MGGTVLKNTLAVITAGFGHDNYGNNNRMLTESAVAAGSVLPLWQACAYCFQGVDQRRHRYPHCSRPLIVIFTSHVIPTEATKWPIKPPRCHRP
jgi:hypothetical protein